jgi:hypothetical protein
MVVLLFSACILLVGAVLERQWLWGAVCAIAIALVGNGLRRRLRHPA